MNNFEYDCSLDNLSIGAADVECILPNWKTKVTELSFFKENDAFEINFFIAAKTVVEVKEWLKEYENKHKCTYSVRSTANCTGAKIQFKQRLNCQHNTSSKEAYNPAEPSETKNTNCPSYIILTLHALKKRYQGKNKMLQLNPDMLCEVRLVPVHNHNIGNADALRFRKVSEETRGKIMELYKCGHTPATALETLKIDIQLTFPQYENVLADRYYCPDYMYCYHLYKQNIEKLGSVELSKEFLKQKINDYNNKNPYSASIDFEGEDYAICICTTLMKRVHSHIKAAGELVFLDSSGTVDKAGNRMFILFTYSECGGLPLAVFITSSESTRIIKKAFELLKGLQGKMIFGGKPEGPDIFLTDDSASEPAAIKTVWPKSVSLLSTFHVAHTIWWWLMETKNCIPWDKQQQFFQEFRSIIYAQTTDECQVNYNDALESAKDFPEYSNFLEKYWERKELWALSYRSYKSRCHNTNSISEAAIRLIKDKIFARIKSFNLVQLIDFMYNTFSLYYERRLLDVAHNRTKENIFGNKIQIPPDHLIDKMQKLYDDVFIVPSESILNLRYLVNMEIVFCTCSYGRAGKICKHIEWTYSLFSNKKSENLGNTGAMKHLYYFIATGNKAPENWLESSQECSEAFAFDSGNDCDDLEANVIENEVNEEERHDKGQDLIEDITIKFNEFLEKSPNEVMSSLRTFKTRLQKIKTVADFVSCCSGFATEHENQNRRSKINLSSASVSQQKTDIEGAEGDVESHPRKRRRTHAASSKVNSL